VIDEINKIMNDNTLDHQLKIVSTYVRFMGIDHSLIKEVNVSTKSLKSSIPKQCYSNCIRYIIRNQKCKYVLGIYLYKGSVPIEHSWIKKPNDMYYDITLSNISIQDKYYKISEYSFSELINVSKDLSSVTLYELYKKGVFSNEQVLKT
jgi:hypothetical protein